MNNDNVENNGLLIDENYLQQSQNNNNRKNKIILILAIVFFVITLALNLFDIFLGADILNAVLTPSKNDGGINVTGLEQGFGLIIYIVFMIPTVIAMILNLVFSILALKHYKKLAITFIVVSVLTFIVHVILMTIAIRYKEPSEALAFIF